MTPLHDAGQEPSARALALPALTVSVLLLLAAWGGAVLAGEAAAPAGQPAPAPTHEPRLGPSTLRAEPAQLVRIERKPRDVDSLAQAADRHRDTLAQPDDTNMTARFPVAGKETEWTSETTGCMGVD